MRPDVGFTSGRCVLIGTGLEMRKDLLQDLLFISDRVDMQNVSLQVPQTIGPEGTSLSIFGYLVTTMHQSRLRTSGER